MRSTLFPSTLFLYSSRYDRLHCVACIRLNVLALSPTNRGKLGASHPASVELGNRRSRSKQIVPVFVSAEQP